MRQAETRPRRDGAPIEAASLLALSFGARRKRKASRLPERQRAISGPSLRASLALSIAAHCCIGRESKRQRHNVAQRDADGGPSRGFDAV
jgi:hypothetical protein